MLKIGLTGNLGSGKSTIARIFLVLGVPVYHADDASRRFLLQNHVQEKVLNVFGHEVFTGTNEIDRKALGKIVFSDPEKLGALNSILHPLVREDFREWLYSKKGHAYVIHEAAIIFESGFRHEFDRIIHVSCPVEVALDRSVKRDNADPEEIKKRMMFQWDDEKKAAMSDYIILNDGSEMAIPQVLKIHDLLVNLSGKGMEP